MKKAWNRLVFSIILDTGMYPLMSKLHEQTQGYTLKNNQWHVNLLDQSESMCFLGETLW